MSNIDSIFNDLYKKVHERIDDVHINITPQTIMTILRYVMEVVELSGLSGIEKKLAVKKLLHKMVDESDLSLTDKQVCENMIDGGIIDNTIDLIVSASKGEFDINKAIVTGGLCCFSLFKLFLSKK